MIKKILLTFLVLILSLLPLVYAELKVEPQSISVIAYVNYEKIIPIRLINTFNFSIFQINFSSLEDIEFPFIEKLEPNESIDTEMKILTKEAYDTTTKYSTIIFRFYTVIYDEPEFHYVTIEDTQYVPNSLEIEVGDYVRWKNEGTISHSVTDTGGEFDKSIPPNGTDLVHFQTVKNYDYYDKNILFHAYIYVRNKSSELTYDSNYDKEILLTINSKYNETTIEISLLVYNFSLDYNTETDELLEVKNVGNFQIKNVTLSADKWISFSENHFNVDPRAKNYVSFTINPYITEIDETNKTHTIEIKAKGINSEEVTTGIYVFIPYEEELEELENLTREELYKKIEELKEILANLDLGVSPECPSNKPYYNINSKECMSENEIKAYLVTYNYTQEEIQTFLLKLGGISEDLKSIGTYQNPIIDDLKKLITENVIPSIQNTQKIANESLVLSKQNREDIESSKSWRLWWWVVIFFIVAGLVTFGLIKYRQYQSKIYFGG